MEKTKSSDGVILNYNKQAMDCLHENNLENALKLLKSAEKILKDREIPKNNSLWGITYNNLGCIYKKAENHKAALHYLTRALDSEIINAYDATNAASTHLNISAILSNMGDHNSSLAHALAALKILQSTVAKSQNYTVSLVIAYHSIGIENELLHRLHEAAAAYKKGWDIAEKELGTENKLTESLKRSFAKVSNIPTMPNLRVPKKKLKIKKASQDFNAGFLPKISTSRNSQHSSFITPLHKSSEDPYGKITYYSVKTRSSLSPISAKPNTRIASEIESINKLIKELDGKVKPKTQPSHKNYKENIREILKIQRWWRGVLVRKRYKEMRMTRKPKIIHKIVRKTGDLGVKRILPAKVILKPIPETKAESKSEAILLIQSWLKMWSARKKFLTKKKAAIKIQRSLRARKVRKLYLLIIDAVVFIQSVFRGYRVRKELKLAS